MRVGKEGRGGAHTKSWEAEGRRGIGLLMDSSRRLWFMMKTECEICVNAKLGRKTLVARSFEATGLGVAHW